MMVVYDVKLSLLIMRAHTIALSFKIVEKGAGGSVAHLVIHFH